MTTTLVKSIDPQIKVFQDISLRAQWLSDQNAWTQTEFNTLVAQVLAIGTADDLEPLFNWSPHEYVAPYIEKKIKFKQGKSL